MIGIVKEEVDPKGLEELQSKYFPYPLYLDRDKSFYKAFGNRKIYKQFSNFNSLRAFPRLVRRIMLKDPNVSGNFKGEGFLQGGVLITSRRNGLIYKHPEITGGLLPLEEFHDVVKSVC